MTAIPLLYNKMVDLRSRLLKTSAQCLLYKRGITHPLTAFTGGFCFWGSGEGFPVFLWRPQKGMAALGIGSH